MIISLFCLVTSLLLDSVISKHGRLKVDDLVDRCKHLKESRVCDPDGILKHAVEDIIYEIKITSENYTCGSTKCGRMKSGCDMYIVINKGMLTKYRNNHLLEEARRFANELMRRLVADTCGNAFLLYYSYLDHVFYVVTEEKVTALLPSDLIGEIALMSKVELSKDIASGLKNLIKNFRLAFRKQYIRKVHFSEPVHGAVMARSSAPSIHFPSWLLLSATLQLCE